MPYVVCLDHKIVIEFVNYPIRCPRERVGYIRDVRTTDECALAGPAGNGWKTRRGAERFITKIEAMEAEYESAAEERLT